MLRIDTISYSIAGRPLIEDASVTIPAGHKVGIVGANGAGKTTLFRIILGELALESGRIAMPKGAKIGTITQDIEGTSTSVLDTVIAQDVERAALLADTSEDPDRIAEIQTRLADIDAWSAEARASSILSGLGFSLEDQKKSVSDFSGGWRMRMALAGLLFASPDFLLLDEPTNYLDLEGVMWLESFLAKYPHTVLLISHDRALLNSAVGHILHLSERKLKLYTGGYDTFAKTRAEIVAQQTAQAKKQDARRAHLQAFVDRFKAKASKAKQAQSRVKALEKMADVNILRDANTVPITLDVPDQLSAPLVQFENATTGYGGLTVLNNISLRLEPDDRIALLGRNGEGKSTFAKLLAAELSCQSGQVVKSNALRIGYFAQHQVDALDYSKTPLETIIALTKGIEPQRARAMLAAFGLKAEQAQEKISNLSGGQKARLSMLLATRGKPHILVFDEPTNHLDIETRQSLADAMNSFEGAIVMVSHDFDLLSQVADRLLLVSDGKVTDFDGDLGAYRDFLLGKDTVPKSKRKVKETPKVKAPPPERNAVLAARAEVRKAEDRMQKLETMETKLQKHLNDPKMYEPGNGVRLAEFQKKFAELKDAQALAEKLWTSAEEKLERLA